MFKYCTSALRASAFLWLIGALALPAQTTLAGNISDGAGGPLMPGNVYLVTSTLTVPTGTTLTILPGAILKFNASVQFVINGNLQANGLPATPIYFLAATDDSIGGDTNGDGPSVGTPGYWRGLRFNVDSDMSAMSCATIRHTGWGGWSGAAIYDSDLTLDQCTFESGSSEGINLNGTAALPTITGCHVANHAGNAVENVLIPSIPGFMNNTASGNGLDTMKVSGNNVPTDVTIIPANCINGTMWFQTTVTVLSGSTLTLEAGVSVKWSAGIHLVVDGTLIINGTTGSPVHLTTIDDDSVAGDTNGDGATPPAIYWRGIRFNSGSSASHLDHAVIGRPGWGGWAGAAIYGSDITLDDCIIRDGSADAIELTSTVAHPTISGCLFQNNNGHAIDNARIESVPGITNNLAVANGTNSFRITTGTTTEDVVITAASNLDGALWFTTAFTIPVGRTVTFGPGVVSKFSAGGHFTADGTLVVNGAEMSETVFTSINDDSIGGDTANDGPPLLPLGPWRGLRFNSTSSASVVTRARIRYSGWGGWAGAAIYGSDVTLDTCVFELGTADGIELNSMMASPSVTDCRIENNSGRAVDGAPIESLPGMIDNVATGNGLDTVYVSGTNVSQDVTVNRRNAFQDVLYFPSGFNITGSFKLTLEAGLILKFNPGTFAGCSAGLDILGDGRNPVVFTSFSDDEYGGDTNNNGPPATSPLTWRGVNYASAATSSTAQHVLVRYSGWGGWTGFISDSAQVGVRSVRVEHTTAGGIDLSGVDGNAVNCVAFDCNGFGIRLDGGTHDLVHATVTACNSGISRTGAATGGVRNSISWGNGGANFSGFGAGDLVNCNGDATAAGSNGNIDMNPLFVDPGLMAGDLHLQFGSPCVDAADYSTALGVIRDHRERSRILDATLTGSFLPDMGAYELPAYELDFTGEARLGTQITFTTGGPAGNSLYVFGLQDGEFLAAPWGFVTAGASADILIFPIILPVGTPLNIELPDAPQLAGFSVGAQTLCVPPSGVATGNLTGLVRLTFFE